jgi:hypothetical protein
MRTKPRYEYRITDNVYIVYKLSNYSRYPIREIEAGLAFTGCEYSSAFKKAKVKYNLVGGSNWITASSHKDFCVRLYLKHFMSEEDKYKLPSNVATLCKYHWNDRMKEMKEELKNSDYGKNE